jgi:phosphonate transport system substrate-binding protein
MLSRRLLLAAAASMALAVPAAQASDWRQQFPEIVFASIPAENASGVIDRWQPFADYLAKELGVKVTLRVASDYAAVIEGQRAGNIHVAAYGPAAYVRAHTVTNGGVEPFLSTINQDGSRGYFSVLYVRTGDTAQRLQDLQGKNLCLVDPNSTSGNNVPRFAMNKMGIDPERFFANVVYAGSHENAVTALGQGTCDAAFNWWNSETDSNLSRMATKNMVKAQDFRIIFRSDIIPNSPFGYLANLPPDMKRAIRQAFLDAPTRAPAAYARLSDGKDRGFFEVTHADYQVVVDLQKFVDDLRRKRGS